MEKDPFEVIFLPCHAFSASSNFKPIKAYEISLSSNLTSFYLSIANDYVLFVKQPSLFQIDEKEVTMIKTHLRQEEEQAYLAGDRRRSMSSRRSSLSSQHSRLQVPNDTQVQS